MGGKKPDKPWTQNEIYHRTQQQLVKMEQATVGTTGGEQLVAWQEYLAQQPTGYTEGGVTPAALQRMQMEAFGEISTVAQNAATGGNAQDRYNRRDADKEGTREVRQTPGIAARTAANPTGFIEGSQTHVAENISTSVKDSPGIGIRGRDVPTGYEGTQARTSPVVPGDPTSGQSDPYKTRLSPDTGSDELDALVAQSAALAGISVVQYSGGKGDDKDTRLRKVTQAARAREGQQQGTETAAQRRTAQTRVNYQGHEFDSTVGAQRAQGGTLGTRESVGAGTLLGSSS